MKMKVMMILSTPVIDLNDRSAPAFIPARRPVFPSIGINSIEPPRDQMENFSFMEAGLGAQPVLPRGHAIAAAAQTLRTSKRCAPRSNNQRRDPTSTARATTGQSQACFCPNRCGFSRVDHGACRRLDLAPPPSDFHSDCANLHLASSVNDPQGSEAAGGQRGERNFSGRTHLHHNNFDVITGEHGPRRRAALAPPPSYFHSDSTSVPTRHSVDLSQSTTTSAHQRRVRQYSGRTAATWNRAVYDRGLLLDDHGTITLDAIQSHQHTINLRKRMKEGLNKSLITSTLADANISTFIRRVDELCERLDRVRPVVNANDIYGDIDAQRDARRAEILNKLLPRLRELRALRLPRYPRYLLAHPDVRRISSMTRYAKRIDVPRHVKARQLRRHRAMHHAHMADANVQNSIVE